MDESIELDSLKMLVIWFENVYTAPICLSFSDDPFLNFTKNFSYSWNLASLKSLRAIRLLDSISSSVRLSTSKFLSSYGNTIDLKSSKLTDEFDGLRSINSE